MADVIIACGDPTTASAAADLLAEDPGSEVVARAATTVELDRALAAHDPDVVVLDDDLGPMRVLDLVRDLVRSRPEVAIVIVVDDIEASTLRQAMQAGARAVVDLPLELDELVGAVRDAAAWAGVLEQRLTRQERDAEGGPTGRLVAMVGAKGGVGTTLLATQAAHRLAVDRPQDRIALVDLDLQTGDVRSLLDITHERGLTDLVPVAANISRRHIEENAYTHSTGLSVMLPPPRGELADDVTAEVGASVVGAVRAHFDAVVVDLGSVLTPAGVAALRLADEIVVVTTPDVPALRGVGRLVELLRRLEVPRERLHVLCNRVTADAEVQPEFVVRTSPVPTTEVVVPEGGRGVEAAVNSCEPSLVDPVVHDAVGQLLVELGLRTPTATGLVENVRRLAVRRPGRRSEDAEAGQVTVEWVALSGLLLVVALAVLQFAVAGLGYVLVRHAAEDAARVLAVSPVAAGHAVPADVAAAAREDLPGWLGDELDLDVDRRDGLLFVEASAAVPRLVPVLDAPVVRATSAAFPEDD